MTGTPTHETHDAHDDRWHDDLSAYALDALTQREADLLEAHLEDCNACRERLVWLQPAVDQIPAAVQQVAAPASLRRGLMDIVDAEADVPRAAAPASREKRGWLPSFGGFGFRPAFAGFAAMLLLAAGVAGYQLHESDNGGGDPTTYPASAAAGFDASGELAVDGDSGSLTVSGMPATERGDVYQAWIKDDHGSVHPSSVFVVSHDGTGTVAIPEGLDDAVEVMVTREPKGGSKLPTENPFLSASVT